MPPLIKAYNEARSYSSTVEERSLRNVANVKKNEANVTIKMPGHNYVDRQTEVITNILSFDLQNR